MGLRSSGIQKRRCSADVSGSWVRKSVQVSVVVTDAHRQRARSFDSQPMACMEAGCGESFESPWELKAHTKVAHGSAFCETCGVSMLKSSLAAHAWKHESEQVLLRCPHPGCLHSYNKRSNLNAHIRAVHMNPRQYACPHVGCEMLFAYKCVRDKHAECSMHAEPVVGGDFETEDSEVRRRARGGGNERGWKRGGSASA